MLRRLPPDPTPNDTTDSPLRRRIPWPWAVLIVVGCMVIFITLGNRNHARRMAPISARSTVAQLATALRQYSAEYPNLPTGDNAQVFAALRGDNPRKIAFFECRPELVSSRGEFLDPWKTPYRIDTSDPDHSRVYSFGKNKQDDNGAPGSDDITSQPQSPSR